METRDNATESEGQTTRKRRRRRWIAVGFIVVAIAVLALTPPLVNVNRYRRRITITMSRSLGRPVHLDNVSLHLLPFPGFTLQNFVVSEDPAFGYEPVIRANTVEVRLRASSLWTRQVEFSTVRFIEPSVNIVRNGQGRWNLEEILMQASRVDTAPTDQRKAGPTPRFPYIEATGARINVKLVNEKMPYSLTDAEFALWLPSPQQWRVRLQGKPMRTDSNISGAGSLRVEGSLQRARTATDVPIDLHISWRNSPLGEATRLLTGEDAGWRGKLFLELSLAGQISHAAMLTHLQLNDLRRSDFVPAKQLDVTVNCSATSNLLQASLVDAQCAVPLDEATPLTLTAASVDLKHPAASAAKAQVNGLPASWVMDWARLFSPRIPTAVDPRGTFSGSLDWLPSAAGWQGRITATLPSPAGGTAAGQPVDAAAPATALNFDIDTAPAPGGLLKPSLVKLEPAILRAFPQATLTLSGQADVNGYSLQLNGSGTSAQVRMLANVLPPLNEGVDTALATNHGDTARTIALTCSRLWNGIQTCEPLVLPEPKPARSGRRH